MTFQGLLGKKILGFVFTVQDRSSVTGELFVVKRLSRKMGHVSVAVVVVERRGGCCIETGGSVKARGFSVWSREALDELWHSVYRTEQEKPW